MYLSLTVFILLWSKAKVQLLYPLLVERFRPHKVYIFLIWITSRVDLAMSACPYECSDLGNYKRYNSWNRHASS